MTSLLIATSRFPSHATIAFYVLTSAVALAAAPYALALKQRRVQLNLSAIAGMFAIVAIALFLIRTIVNETLTLPEGQLFMLVGDSEPVRFTLFWLAFGTLHFVIPAIIVSSALLLWRSVTRRSSP